MAPNADFQAALAHCQIELPIGSLELKSTTTNKKPKTVDFVPSCAVYEVPHINDMPMEDVRAIWWSTSDFSEFKHNISETVALMTAQGVAAVETNDSTARGLENYIPQRREKRTRRREQAYKTVLLEQQLQWQEGSCDPEYIAEIYAEISVRSHKEANSQALRDQAEVMKMKRRASRRSSSSSSSTTSSKNDDDVVRSPRSKHRRSGSR
jgi:hypothetical protein